MSDAEVEENCNTNCEELMFWVVYCSRYIAAYGCLPPARILKALQLCLNRDLQ